uniref:Protein kinase domain-containing protein n=1 Tax=Panagrellus redivivus TaxID=6233 RepID=A0A7E4V1X7_PANRE
MRILQHTYCGTPDYAAPELLDLSNLHGHNHKVDVWSLGIVFYEMMEGKTPFDGMTGTRRKEAIRRGLFRDAVNAPDWAMKLLLVVNVRNRTEIDSFRADRLLQEQVQVFHRSRLYADKQTFRTH